MPFRNKNDGVRRQSVATRAIARRLPRGYNAGGAVSRDFLAPVRQQLFHWSADDGSDRADRIAGELRREPYAAEQGSLLTNAALLTYAIPASFLIVPYFRIMHSYGLSDNPWAVIATQVTFATPFAILLLQLYASLLPFELDDAARV